ncbi:MAG: hypothetical protein ABI548_27425 [Polyangiaceae bacterium]
MMRLLSRVGLGLIALVGLYFTVVVGIIAGGFIAGFVSARKSPPVSIQYVHCDGAHPSPECAELVKSRPASSAR